MTASPTYGQKVIRFNLGLEFTAPLPPGIGVMNPFRDNDCALGACNAFYTKYYDDHLERHIVLGINPGRFGAGLTGIPFTDPKRLRDCCDIHIPACPAAHEPSSQFVYEAIGACGGPEKFYKKWYINSLCPLGFTHPGKNGKPVNYNYYDDAALCRAATPFIIETLRKQLDFGIKRDACICFGTGKNAQFLERLNASEGFFGKIVPLEHPRYIMQYKTAQIARYVAKYREIFEQYS